MVGLEEADARPLSYRCPVTKTSRKRFRKILLPLGDLEVRSLSWAGALEPVQSSWKVGDLTDAEAAGLYLLVSLQFWFPNDWLSGPDPLASASPRASLPLLPWLDLNARTRAKLPADISLAGLIHGYSFKAIRRDARNALSRWLNGEIDLRLTDVIPTPEEVLSAQVNGGRWVSALFSPEYLGRLVHDGRDALSFLLHDLGHAEKFFGSDLHPEAQVGCYRLLQKALLAGKFDQLRELDSQWEERLHYLIADLNSHPIHILSVFWGAARDVFRKTLGDSSFEQWQQGVYALWNWEEPVQRAYLQVLRSRCADSAALLNARLSQSLVN